MPQQIQANGNQLKAITITDKNLIVVAGAGSGKTHVLVERYLYLLEQNAVLESDPTKRWRLNNLVAITFTREAALEMRNRVRIELEKRRQNAENDTERARWTELLRQMNSARIGTIHSLCTTILRANAAEAGIDPRFEVMDDIQSKVLLQRAVDEALRECVAAETDALSLLESYDLSRVKETLSNPSFVASDFSEVPQDAESIYQDWYVEWETIFRQKVAELVRFAQDRYPLELPEKEDTLVRAWQAYQQWIDELAEYSASFNPKNVDAMLELLRELTGYKQPGKISKAWDETEGVLAKDQWIEIKAWVTQFFKDVGEFLPEIEQRAAQELVWWCELIVRVQRKFQRLKQARALLDFDDLERCTRDLLQQHPDVCKRYRGVEFKHILVDEFQDTNIDQWEIIQGIADLTLGGAVFCVGDPKQSIYAFRGADVSVFNKVREQIGDTEKGEDIPLLESFRSHERLVNTLNAIFNDVFVKDLASPVRDYQVSAEAMTAFRKPAPTDDKLPVKFLLLEPKERDENGDYCLTDKGKPVSLKSEQIREWEAQELASLIQSMIVEQTPVFDKPSKTLRNLRYGDVAILLQTMNHCQIYEEVFKEQGIPYVTVAGKGFYSRQEIWDVLNLLKALYNPFDHLSLASVLRSPMFNFSDEMLLALRLPIDGEVLPLWDAIPNAIQQDILGIQSTDRPVLQFAWNVLVELAQIAERITLADLLRLALEKTGYLAMISGLPDGARRRRNVEKLVNIATANRDLTIGAFTQYLDDLIGDEIREGEAAQEPANTVRIMTVHASKGLEFPLVILANADWERRGGGQPVILHQSPQDVANSTLNSDLKATKPFKFQQISHLEKQREDAERRRLFYVAATRARDYLVVSGKARQNDETGLWESKMWLGWLLESAQVALQPGENTVGQIANQAIDVSLPFYTPKPHHHMQQEDARTGWEIAPPAVQPAPPPYLAPIDIAPDAPIVHLAATQLANIGGARFAASDEDRQQFYDNFRRKVLYDAPSHIPATVASQRPRVTGRLIGEIVHEALRYWRFPDNTPDLQDVLIGYAWQHKLTDEQDRREAVQRATLLLQKFQNSNVYRDIQEAKTAKQPVYSEIPFIFHQGDRIIHGIIDVLFQDIHGQWIIVDYKTGVVDNYRAGYTAFAEHARRYYLQVGAYAAAVMEQLQGIEPQILIHYLRYTKTVKIPTQQCLSEVNQLEQYISELIGQSHD